jgi:peptidoglycan/xylan/chitin deacetylase (PgdA/CDA1 family)
MEFRLDRLASLYGFSLAAAALRPFQAPRIPVLMYHSVSAGSGGKRGHPYYDVHVSPKRFREQMDFLSRNGYKVLSLADVSDIHAAGLAAGERCVVLTFDDLYENNYSVAYPVLKAYGYTATFFAPTGFISPPGGRLFLNDRPCMNWSEVEEMHRNGFRFGSHTVDHIMLHTAGRAEVCRQLQLSKRQLEEKLGWEVTSFAYPYAFPEADPRFVAGLGDLLSETGYLNGVTTTIGRVRASDNMLFMKRLPVNDADTEDLFRAKLDGAYDWMHAVQYTVKLAKQTRNRRAYGLPRETLHAP